ncbi:hypothetical protein AVEN_189614-1 [Araneus ventricosus]|uniref:Uncharacterized protein n=1 Tax=Araneus ventricosus TaxID=182803 RepID=A0A4Y2WTV1_ARAVE|nr:hypothetical protein AVEN_189614-1 [Araneus ventricosus]
MLRNRKECSLLIGRSFPLLATRENGEKLLPLVSLGVGGTSKLKVATIFSLYLSTRRRELFGTTSCRYVRGRAPDEVKDTRKCENKKPVRGGNSLFLDTLDLDNMSSRAAAKQLL